jgi:hypothetical protein
MEASAANQRAYIDRMQIYPAEQLVFIDEIGMDERSAATGTRSSASAQTSRRSRTAAAA